MTATMTARSTEQRDAALRHANAIRTRRSHLKQDVKAGRLRAVDVLLDPPAEAQTMTVCELLLAMRRVGRVRALRVLRRCGMSESKKLGALSDRQRNQLAEVLGR